MATNLVNFILFSIHRDAVQVDRLHDLLSHDVNRAEVRQREVEEAGACAWQSLVLVLPLVILNALDLETNILSLELFVIGRNDFLSPAELNELLEFLLGHQAEHLPEHFNCGVLC